MNSQRDEQIAVEIRTGDGSDNASVANGSSSLGQVGLEVLRQQVPLRQALGMLVRLNHAPARGIPVVNFSCRLKRATMR